MIPQDMMAQLGGGGGAPAGPGGGGDALAALLGGAGAPADAGRPSITDGAPGGGEDPLTQAIDLIQQAIDAEGDQEDIQVMLQCQTKLQQVLAKSQAEGDQMLQGKMTPRGIRKATAGGGGY